MKKSLNDIVKHFLIHHRGIRDVYFRFRISRPSERYAKFCRGFAWFRSFLPQGRSISEAFARFPEQVRLAEQSMTRRGLIRDIIFCRMFYHIKTMRYFIFEFRNRTPAEREEYIGVRECRVIEELMNDPSETVILKNKFRTYRHFQEFYKREIIRAGSEADADRLKEFCGKHGRVILKPLAEKQGIGIRLFDAAGENAEEVLRYAREIMPCVAEECIEQAGIMKEIHPQSVNTVRALTCLVQGEVHLLYALLRVGQGDAVVDNLNAGGLGAAIDTETGEIVTDAFSEDCYSRAAHPDTGIVFKGTRIPEWDALIRMIGEMHRKLPKVGIIGWDLAYSERGWCMVEGNNLPSFIGVQMCTKRGFRSRVKPVLEKAIPKYYSG